MGSSLLITLEIGLVLGLVVVLGGWDLWSLRREQARDRKATQASPRAEASEKATGTEPSQR